jgi:hypothetical protein
MSADDRWDDALDTAADVIDSVPIADQVQVIAAGRSLEILTSATLDKAAARQSILGLEPSNFFVDFGQLTRSLDGVLRTAGWRRRRRRGWRSIPFEVQLGPQGGFPQMAGLGAEGGHSRTVPLGQWGHTCARNRP